MFRRFMALLAARNLEFLRDRAALSWNVLFPVVLVASLAFAFSGDPIPRYKVGLYGTTAESSAGATAFLSTDYIHFIPVDNLDVAIRKTEHHQLDMVLDLRDDRYWINDNSPSGYLLERILRGSTPQASLSRQIVTGREIRYIDWVIPGILAMNMMFSALYGVGYVIVRYRKNGVLKRLKATPLGAFEFLAAQVVSRLWLIMLVTVVVFLGTDLFLDFTMHGSYVHLLTVFALGAVSVISLGLLIATRTSSEELAEGLLNLISWPMMFLSGVWFSLEGTNPLVQKIAQVFPLTHLIAAARAIMIDGASLVDVTPQLLTLGLTSALFLLLASLAFRWD